MAPKNNLRDKLDDDTLDLSLMQLEEVPVKEIVSYQKLCRGSLPMLFQFWFQSELPKGTIVDLSNNHLDYLPDTFPTLTHIVRLDLSKNSLRELPEYFGQLRNLRHLDLYSNQLERLPVSFAQLKNLKWLDLKNNPLVPALHQAAGPCVTASDCALCAKKVCCTVMHLNFYCTILLSIFLNCRSLLCCKACRVSLSARGRSISWRNRRPRRHGNAVCQLSLLIGIKM